MWLADYAALAIIIAALIWGNVLRRQLGGRFLLSGAILIMALVLGYTTYLQFVTWQENEISRFLLPPHNPINYFIFYTFTRIWLQYLISLIVGLVVLTIAQYFNRKHPERFFYKDEPYLLALGLFLPGHPGWILYLVLALTVHLLVAIGYTLVAKQTQRLSFYHFWLPLAAIAIILDPWLSQFEFYSNLIL